MGEKSLRTTTLRGIGWSSIDSIANQGITFLVGLVLARLLGPEEYGLIGIITIFVNLFNTIVDSGFSNALIRKKESTEDDYNTVFITNLVLSVVLGISLFLSAPIIAKFFKQTALIPISKVMSTIVVINAFAIIQRTNLVKKIDFKTQTKASLISSLSSGAIGIIMAVMGYGVWALVGQQLSRQLLNTISLWFYNRWIPKMRFSKKSFKELFSFSWKLLLSQLITSLWNEVNHIVIGRCYSSQALGQYTRSHQFASIFSSNLTSIIQRVSFPVLSSIQDEKERMKQAYRKIIKITMFVAFCCMFVLAAVSKPLIYVLIGEKWDEAASYLPLLCFMLVLYPIRAINTNMLQVCGRSDQLLILEIIKKTLAVGPLLLGVFVSIRSMLFASVLVDIIGFILNSHFSGKYIKYSTWSQVKDIFPSFTIAAFVALFTYLLSFIHVSYYYVLVIQLIFAFLAIVALSELFNIAEYKEIKALVQRIIKKII